MTDIGFAPALARAIETDRSYFDQGAELKPLDGAVLAWMPGLTASAAAAVIHRVDPEVIAQRGAAWIAEAEAAMAATGAALARIYLDERHADAGEQLRLSGYSERDELVFVGDLPDPPSEMALRPVTSDADWNAKL